MKIKIPDNVMRALEILEQNGFEAYAVGGCVRDILLGLSPYDWDICTSALPEQTMECFADFRVIPTGIKHGTVTVIVDSPLEITTFRIDGDYLDNRRPSEVSFTRKLEDDLCRRDFTINAMVLRNDGTTVDLYGGYEDLKAKLIRCVGCAETRFEEDALRIMRALRFATTLDFEIEVETAKAIHAKKHLLANIAAERIQKEFSKLLTGNCEKILGEFEDVIRVFLPEAATSKSNLQCISNSPNDISLRLALLLSHLNPSEAQAQLRTLRYDNRTIAAVSLMINSLAEKIHTDRPHIKRLINKYGYESIGAIIDFNLCCGRITADEHSTITEIVCEIQANDECCTLAKLAVKGKDIDELNIFQKKQIGKVLYVLLEKVMDGEIENKKKALISEAKNLKY